MTPRHAPPLFARLVDDAGLFPPEELAMPAALARHLADDAAGHPVHTGRFLCPASRLPELQAALGAADTVRIGLIGALDRDALGPALARVAADPRLVLAAVEGPLGDDLSGLAEVPDGVPVHLEVPPAGDPAVDPAALDAAALDAAAATGRALKVRCGGLRAELFPTAGRLGALVHGCVRRGVAFKATAGLHHAVAHTDPRTGFAHHGFLNLLLATHRAVDGGSPDNVAAVLRSRDRAALVEQARAVPPDRARAARRVFVGYGSCSTSEPVEDLRALGLLEPTEVTA